MSSKKNKESHTQTNSQKYDYMKKKQNKNKDKNFQRDRKNFQLNDENELPDGLFSKDIKSFQKEKCLPIIEDSNNIELNKPNLNNKLDDDNSDKEEYEDYDPSYFDQIQLK
jgi:hypothetical protein